MVSTGNQQQCQVITATAVLFLAVTGILLLVVPNNDIKEPPEFMVIIFFLFVTRTHRLQKMKREHLKFQGGFDDHDMIKKKNELLICLPIERFPVVQSCTVNYAVRLLFMFHLGLFSCRSNTARVFARFAM